MIRRMSLPWLAALAVSVFTGLVLAQAPELPPRPHPHPMPEKPKDDPPAPKIDPILVPGADLKDPTRPSPKLREAMNAGKAAPAAPGASRFPVVALRGRIIAKGRPPAALVEGEGKLYTVSQGSVLPGGGSTILRVTEVSSTEVRLEVAPLNETILLR